MMELIPTSHQLAAALRVASVLSTEERAVSSLRAGYDHLPSDGIFDMTDLIEGEFLLVAAGLAQLNEDRLSLTRDLPYSRSEDESTARELLLMELLAMQTPTWITIATATGNLQSELVPSEAERTLAAVITDPSRREAMLLDLGQKFEATSLANIGAIGERAVFTECQQVLVDSGTPDLAAQVVHVSLVSDALGYDITTPTVAGGIRRLEVKTMGASRTLIHVFLSRNEYKTGASDKDWRLVICRLVSESSAEILGWCSGRQLSSIVPIDSSRGRWTVSRLEIDVEDLHPGLPLEQTG